MRIPSSISASRSNAIAPRFTLLPFKKVVTPLARRTPSQISGERCARDTEMRICNRRAISQVARSPNKDDGRRYARAVVRISCAIVPRSATESRGHQATTGLTRSVRLPRRQGADVLRNTAKPRFHSLHRWWWRRCFAVSTPSVCASESFLG